MTGYLAGGSYRLGSAIAKSKAVDGGGRRFRTTDEGQGVRMEKHTRSTTIAGSRSIRPQFYYYGGRRRVRRQHAKLRRWDTTDMTCIGLITILTVHEMRDQGVSCVRQNEWRWTGRKRGVGWLFREGPGKGWNEVFGER